jgi:ubiquitin carboxyl-terminal hydrolase 7
VHSGGLHGGHYYAFIRPNQTQWLKFDDDRVELVDASKAMNDQFGKDWLE